MGGEQSTSNNGQLKCLSEFSSIGHRDDKICSYGEIKVYQANEDPSMQLAVIARVCPSEHDFNRLLSKYHKMFQLNEVPGMIKLYEVTHQKEDAFCSNLYKVTAAFEYHSNNLQASLDERMMSSMPFDTPEVMSFLHQLLDTLHKLEQRNYFHGDLRPQNILLCQGQYKLSDTHTMDQYRKFMVGLEEHCYLPPELFSQMALRTMRPTMQRRQVDVFTFGLTTLCLGTLNTTAQIYNFDTYHMNMSTLESIITQFQERHGAQLTAFIRLLLALEVELRPTFEQLFHQFMHLKSELEVRPTARRQPSPNNRYSNQSSRRQSPQQYQYSSRKPHIDSSFLHKLDSNNEPQIQLNEYTSRKNWASEFLNDADAVIHVPCNPRDDYLTIEGDFKRVEEANPMELRESTTVNQAPTITRPPSQQKNMPRPQKNSTTPKSNVGSSLKRPKSAFYKKENVKQTLPRPALNNKWVR